MKYYTLLLLTFFLFSQSYSQRAELNNINWHLKNAFKVQTYKDGRLSKTGSGFILYSKKINNGEFEYCSITNEHVLENSDSADVILNDNQKIKIEYINDTYHSLDITLFSFIAHLDSLGYFTYNIIKKRVLNDSTNLGENVLTISSPKGLLNSLSSGILSGSRILKGHKYYQFTAPISPGSSGGAMLGFNNLPLGVVVSQFSEGQNINFSIPLKIIFDTIVKKYSTDDLGKIKFHHYRVSELDLKIQEIFTEAKEISDEYKINSQSAYFKIKKYEFNELPFGMLFLKIKYEIEKKLWFSFLESFKFHLSKYGYSSLTTLYLSKITLNITASEFEGKKEFISSIENLDPLNENSFKIFTDYQRSCIAFDLKDYTFASNLFSKIETTIYSDNANFTEKFFGSLFATSLGYNLGFSYINLNNFEKAESAFFKGFISARINKDEKMIGITAGWYVYSNVKLDNIKLGCDFYKQNSALIQKYFFPDLVRSISNLCQE